MLVPRAGTGTLWGTSMATAIHLRFTHDRSSSEPTHRKALSRRGNLRHSSPPGWRSVRLAGLLVGGAQDHDAVGAMVRGYGLTRAGRS